MDAEQTAELEYRDNTISKVYHDRNGGRTANKTYLDAKAIDPHITLDLTKGWFRRNMERTKQIGGARNSYAAPYAYSEYQADLFFVTKRQFPNQTLHRFVHDRLV